MASAAVGGVYGITELVWKVRWPPYAHVAFGTMLLGRLGGLAVVFCSVARAPSAANAFVIRLDDQESATSHSDSSNSADQLCTSFGDAAVRVTESGIFRAFGGLKDSRPAVAFRSCRRSPTEGQG